MMTRYCSQGLVAVGRLDHFRHVRKFSHQRMNAGPHKGVIICEKNSQISISPCADTIVSIRNRLEFYGGGRSCDIG